MNQEQRFFRITVFLLASLLIGIGLYFLTPSFIEDFYPKTSSSAKNVAPLKSKPTVEAPPDYKCSSFKDCKP